MPNTDPPIVSAELLENYRAEIDAALASGQRLSTLMTFKLLSSLDPETLPALKEAGAVGGKLYPAGVTTNSEDGVRDVRSISPQLEMMQELGLVLEVHGESPNGFVLDREAEFLPDLEWIVTTFPSLRVVLEHVTSAAAVHALERMPERVGATITVHHLLITLDDVIGGKIRPHLFCKPVAKREADREELLAAVFGGSGRFFFGSDSAPHPVSEKEASCGCAGVYTAPVAMSVLAELFEDHGVPLSEDDRKETDATSLERFTSRDGAAFYGLERNTGILDLAEEEWVVPASYGTVVPFRAGKILRYKAKKEGGNEP